MSDHSGQLIVILTTICWWQSLGETRSEQKITSRIHMERFNLKELNEVEGKKQYRVEISNSFARLENLDTEVYDNKAWETIRENIKISAKESLKLL
jgi:hypothetical protein